MRTGPRSRWLLALLLAVAPALSGATASVPAAAPDTVTIHRCVDGKGHVTLQDGPCPAGSRDTLLQMLRPKDPPPPRAAPAVKPTPAESPPPPPARPPAPTPPPAMYRCTSYDGIERFSESYDPNPRCEPLGLYYPPAYLTPESARMCRWVEDSCVRLSDAAACDVWRQRKVKAQSDLLRAFSDTAAYRRSELERINQILDESCP